MRHLRFPRAVVFLDLPARGSDDDRVRVVDHPVLDAQVDSAGPVDAQGSLQMMSIKIRTYGVFCITIVGVSFLVLASTTCLGQTSEPSATPTPEHVSSPTPTPVTAASPTPTPEPD